ncbi:hypothetical protein JVT61DRAFT_12745 [Boletus reticuloceps]|uniref:IMD domain-containing protein n=1 Tax=Boletus reticuloceps TaxID=495285 RepID=A0A8I3ADI4_9AGAM|nr:hypothetical protein JVT61DRAFT_12745 [Boletus reticuloceps]
MPRKNYSLRSITLSPKRSTSPGPPSPTFSDATHASAIHFGVDGPEKIITRANLKVSLQAYDELMSSSANYRAALLHMSKATATFADSLEKCSGLKGPSYEAGTRLQAASGLHHLIGNHWHVLAESLDKSFEKPLRQHLDTYKTIVHERSASYEKALREKSEIIRQTETGNMNKKQRNLQSFREALSVLQRQVDDLDDLKAQHYREIMEHEEEVWNVVQAKVCVAVRSTMDVFDRFTAKAYVLCVICRCNAFAPHPSIFLSSDPILEPMLQSVPDPFDTYGPPQAEDQIFTILPPLAVIANAPSPSPSPLTNTPPASSSPPDTINHSWAPAGNFFSGSSSEWSDVSSASSISPRSTSPSAALKRRQSHPPSTSHPLRKSDSKLRSVLTVIDESHVVHAMEIPEAGRSEPKLASPSDVNGGARPPSGSEEWGTFGYGDTPDTDTIPGDETPRRSSALVATLHTPSYDHDQTMEPGLDPDTRSERTIQLDSGQSD